MLSQLYQFVTQWSQPITDAPLLGGVVVQATFTAADTDVAVFHNLGSDSVVCLPGTGSEKGFVYNSPNQSQTPTKSVLLRASAPLTAQLYFFEN